MPSPSNNLLWKGYHKNCPKWVNRRNNIGGFDLDATGGNLRLRRPVGDNDIGLVITQEDTTNNPAGLNINNSGTGNSLYINHDGITGGALYVDAETTTGTTATLDVDALTTGKGLHMTADALTTGSGIHIESTSAVIAAGELLNIDLTTSGSSITAKTDALVSVTASREEKRTSGTTTDNYDALSISRTNIANGAGGTLTAQGSALKLALTQTQTAGTLTASDYLLEAVETTPVTNALKNVVSIARYCAGNAAANFGLGIEFRMTNGNSTDEEWASIDLNVETATNGSEEGGMLFKVMTAGAVANIMTLGNDVNIVKDLNLDAALDLDHAITAAGNFASVVGTANHATADVEAVRSEIATVTTNRTGGVVAGVLGKVTSLSGDTGGDFSSFVGRSTDGGGTTPNHMFLFSEDAYDAFLKGEADGDAGMTLGAMTKSPESVAEDGYITVDIAGTKYQVPFYAA